jgi:protein-disulfide isomerase
LANEETIVDLNELRSRLAEKNAGLWVFIFVALAVALAGCESVGTETEEPEATAVVKALPEGQLFTVGFTEEGNAFKGDPNASVTVEEYSSFQCPFCGRFFAETYPDLISEYVEQGKVLYIFNDFPLAGQPQSPKAAEAARCAGDVGGAQAFWDMHDTIFGNQSEWSGQSDADELFKGYAAELAVDQAAFDECLDSGRMADLVQADWQEGRARGVNGTPSFFINDELLVGAQPFQAFASALDRALAGEPAVAASDSAPASAGDAPSVEALVPTPVPFDFAADDQEDSIFALGDPEAPVTIVEFSDFQCPVCATHFERTWPALKEQYIDTGRVYYVFRDLPLTSIHPQAFKAHEAARCAFELGGIDVYWQMHDRLFENQKQWSENEDHLRLFAEYAADLGLDQSDFEACLESGRHAGAVEASVREAFGLGVSGTPTFFIDGYPFSGAHPIQNFDQIITLAENDRLRDAIAEAIAAAQAQQEQQAQPRPTMAPADVPVEGAPFKGDADAPVTIVEYSDYQCPFCSRHFQETLPQLLENYVETGRVRYVFKDFPLTSIHPQAPKAAEAARCAREIGDEVDYWEMHDLLFEGQPQWSGNPEAVTVFKGYAGELGLDQDSFDECLDSGRHAAAVEADLREGAGFGVTGTPAFFINGQPLSGAQPYAVFEQVIDTMLAGE